METQMKINSAKRKRGRPAGKNRVPLSAEERRARNAQYERERRTENSDALCELAQAVGCGPSVPNSDVLATVVSFLSRAASRGPSESIATLKRQNRNLLEQIADLEQRLGVTSGDSQSDTEESSNYSYGYRDENHLRLHNNNVGSKRVKLEPNSPNMASSDISDGASLIEAFDSASLSRLIVDTSSPSSDGVTNFGRHWSIEDLINEYL